MAIKKGDKIKVDYVGSLEEGTVFDSSEKHEQPLEFQVGSGMIIKGFDDAVIGMNKGDEKEITLQPEEAYGKYRPELARKIPKYQIPDADKAKEGMIIMIGLPGGDQVPARITKVEKDGLTLDMNPVLAGKVLKFKIKIIEVN